MISSPPTIDNASAAIRDGTLQPRELVDFCLERIRRLDGGIRAWVLVDEEGARERAEQLSRPSGLGPLLGPLHGIPLGIKDIIDVQGMPTRAGSRVRPNRPAERDAPLAARLKAAGAIVLGKTVTTEWAYFDPPPTRNPWNPRHTPGGSSSGSAAAVSLGMCLGAVGTQTGGSIIRPASYCGVAGLKPTAGAVSLEGVVPISPHLDHAGPLARCADDLARLFLGMAEPTAVEASVRELQAHAPAGATGHASDPGASCPWPVLPTELAATPVIRVVEAPFLAAASPDVQSATRRAIERLSLGPAENVLPADWLGTVLRHHRRIMAYDAARVHQRAYGEAPHCFGPHIAGLIETGLALPRAEYEEALAHQQACRQSCLQLFPDSTLLLLPATNTAAPDRLDTTGDPAFNSPWSYTGLPAVTIPCGLSADGMPCGLQLLGPPHSELRLLRAAVWCEEQLGFRQQPPGA